jgi:hypothetical protein
MDESEFMALLADRIAAPDVQSALAEIAGRLRRELAEDPSEPKSTFSPIPISLYGDLPAEIRSSWLFHLRAGLAHPAERHPNSIQRMFAFDRPGWFDWWDGSRWISQLLKPGGPGLSIPIDTWHHMPAQPNAWTVVSFHTTDANSLIEIVGDPQSGRVSSERQYLAPQDQS